jgi:hypothetical protein
VRDASPLLALGDFAAQLGKVTTVEVHQFTHLK